MASIQRKLGVGFAHPVSWKNERRFTSPGFVQKQEEATDIFMQEGPLMRVRIEAYLDDHPEFMESYVLRKVTRATIDKWNEKNLKSSFETWRSPRVSVNDEAISRKTSESSYLMLKSRRLSNVRSGPYSADCTPLLRRSQSVTPHRKISAATFEGGCHSPLLTRGEDGSTSFLTVPPLPEPWRQAGNRARTELHTTCNSPPQMTQLQDDLASDLNQGSLAIKVARNLRNICRAQSVSVLQVMRTGQRISLLGAALNVSKDCQDEDCLGQGLALDTELTSQLVELAREGRGETYTREQLLEAARGEVAFLQEGTKQVTVLPLPDVEGEASGLAILCLGDSGLQDIHNNKLVKDVCKLSGICLKNASDFHSVRLEVTRSQVFLDLARVIFEQETSIEFTVFKMLANFISLIECERAQVLLSSKESPGTFQKVYDLEDNDFLEKDFDSRKQPYENRFPMNSAITGIVARMGETVNIGDASIDWRFDDNLNSDAHLQHRSLLCMPIRDSDNAIIGVVSLINKKSGCFSSNDESFVEAFGVFCGISLANVSNYERAKEAEARSQVALDIMAYHASASKEEAEQLARLQVPSALTLRLQTFSFTDSEMEDIDTLKASLRMFHDLNLVQTFNLEAGTLCRWLLTVKKNYRPEVVYHNWRHGFNVAQVMFSSLCSSGWWEGLGPVTCLGLIIACLCHDLDHRGTSNGFQLATNSPLARLYSTSTMERHHLNQTLVILNLEGSRILEHLSPGDYAETLAVVEEAILATDLSLHFQHLGRLKGLAEQGPAGLDWSDSSVVSIAKAALMTGADLGATTKPWMFQKEAAGLVSEEFWKQGDLERGRGSQPIPIMDREKRQELPRLQVGFCEGVCLPVYQALSSLSPQLKPLEEAVLANIERWEELAEDVENTDEESKVTRNL